VAAASAEGENPMYMDGDKKQFGAWRLNDAANSSAVKFSIFFPDR